MSSSSAAAAFSPEQFQHGGLCPSSEQLCYVPCNLCDTVLAVSVPCSSLFKTVTVRCGHCSNLFSVNMRALLLPPPPPPTVVLPPPPPASHLPHYSFFTPQTLLEEIRSSATPNMLVNQQARIINVDYNNESPMPAVRGGGGLDELIPKPPTANRPPEKRQRVPSAYNRFIKEEIQRIKAGNPEISHREAFSAAAKNWAHFPHIHFGILPDHQPVMKKPNVRQLQEAAAGDEIFMKDGSTTTTFMSHQGNIGHVSPY